MVNFLKKAHKKILEVRSSDKKTKKMWFVGCSITAMTIVVFLWVGYLSVSLPSIAGPEQLARQGGSQESTGVLQATVSKSVDAFQGIRRGFLEIIENIKAPKEIEIEIP